MKGGHNVSKLEKVAQAGSEKHATEDGALGDSSIKDRQVKCI